MWRVATLAVLCLGCTVSGFADPPAQAAKPAFTRGIAISASDIGHDYPVEALVEFVEQGHFDPVVIDWGWVTARWHKTDPAAVNRLRRELVARGVEVPAMYRPYWLDAYEQPGVPEQVKRDGSPAPLWGHRPCYLSPEARRWARSWGEKILQQCPDFDEIIIYSPINQCECPRCLAALAADPTAHEAAAWSFLAEARAAWRILKPSVKLGVVYFADPKFWQVGRDIVDAARPFLSVQARTDMPTEVAGEVALRDVLKDRLRACTAKILWDTKDKVPTDKLAELDRLARANDLPYYLWSFDTAFLSQQCDPQVAAQSLGLDWGALRPSLRRMGLKEGATGQVAGGQPAPGPTPATGPATAGATPPSAGLAIDMRATVARVATSNDYTLLDPLRSADDNAVVALAAMLSDRQRTPRERFIAAVGLSRVRSAAARTVLLAHTAETDPLVRQGVVMCLGYFPDDTGEVRTALTQAATGDPYGVTDAKTRAVRYPIREVARSGLERLAKNAPLRVVTPAAVPALAATPTPTPAPTPIPAPAPATHPISPPSPGPRGRVNLAEALAGKCVTLVNVGDVIRLENTGPAVADLELDRYLPAVDSEQVVLGRWVRAQTAEGQALAVAIAAVTPDTQGNLIQTLRLPSVPEKCQLAVILSSLVARRERPAPAGSFPIPAATDYPPEVRPFLEAGVDILRDHPEIRAVASALLAQTHDAYQVALRLAAIMKAKPPGTTGWEQGLPVPINVLRHGGSCCMSAITAAAILRACGIPTQITYTCPPSYIHGIIRFYLPGDGWVRMDSTCGAGRLPLIQSEEQLGWVRLYDMPRELEAVKGSWGWPYMHYDGHGGYPYRCGGRPCRAVRGGHYENGVWGSGNEVLGSVANEGVWLAWDDLVSRSRAAVMARTIGEFTTVTDRAPGVARYVAAMNRPQG